jgi:hypothetical protein
LNLPFLLAILSLSSVEEPYSFQSANKVLNRPRDSTWHIFACSVGGSLQFWQFLAPPTREKEELGKTKGFFFQRSSTTPKYSFLYISRKEILRIAYINEKGFSCDINQ